MRWLKRPGIREMADEASLAIDASSIGDGLI